MAAFNRFAGIIRGLELAERRQLAVKAAASQTSGCGVFFLVLSGLALVAGKEPKGILIFALVAVICFISSFLQRRKLAPVPQGVQSWQNAFAQHEGAAELLEELRAFERQGMLGQRTHPQMLDLLERAAQAVTRIEKSCAEQNLESLAETDEWRGVMESSRKAAQEALVDSLWIGRHLFRRKGQRTTTFARKCEDPAWGAEHIAAIEEIVQDLEVLAANLSGDLAALHTNRSPLQQALADLEERHVAQAELEQAISGGL